MNTLSVNTENSNEDVPSMNTLSACINKMVKEGYTHSFKITNQGLYSEAKDYTYPPTEVRIINFYRFEGQSDPADNSILYVVETNDGLKGTLVDAYGTYADEKINKFIGEVQEINKKNAA